MIILNLQTVIFKVSIILWKSLPFTRGTQLVLVRVLSTLMLSTSTSMITYVSSGLSTSTSKSTEIRYLSTTSTKYSSANPDAKGGWHARQ